jgi:hypothetical protein
MKIFTRASAMPLPSGLWPGMKHGARECGRDLDGTVGGKIEPLSESQCTRCGAPIEDYQECRAQLGG